MILTPKCPMRKPFFTPAACPTPHHAVRNAPQYFPQSTRVLAAEYFAALRKALFRLQQEDQPECGRRSAALRQPMKDKFVELNYKRRER